MHKVSAKRLTSDVMCKFIRETFRYLRELLTLVRKFQGFQSIVLDVANSQARAPCLVAPRSCFIISESLRATNKTKKKFDVGFWEGSSQLEKLTSIWDDRNFSNFRRGRKYGQVNLCHVELPLDRLGSLPVHFIPALENYIGCTVSVEILERNVYNDPPVLRKMNSKSQGNSGHKHRKIQSSTKQYYHTLQYARECDRMENTLTSHIRTNQMRRIQLW